MLAATAILLAVAMIALAWPGTLTPDSSRQLEQVATGIVTDWHPPIMVRLWMLIGGSVAAMLVLQVALHWLGIWAFARALHRYSSGWAWAMMAVGLTPIALKYTSVIQKDSLLAGFMVAAFGVTTLNGGRRLPVTLGAIGALCRINGVFALPPLLLARATQPHPLRAVAWSMALALALVPITSAINHRLLMARETGVARSLQLFDLIGIERFSGDRSILLPGTEHAPACYTPLFWDSLVSPGCSAPLERLPPSLTAPWLHAIVKHPLAYAQHRLAHFNRTIFLVVPPMQQCVDAPTMHRCDLSAHGKLVDVIAKNALLWPATWLAIGLALLWVPLEPSSRMLLYSALLYGFAYLIIGVASDFRYFYWTELALQIAIVVQLGSRGSLPRWRRPVIAALGVVVVGYGARLALS